MGGIAMLLTLLESPLGRLLMYLVGGLLLVAVAVMAYFIWKANIQALAVAQYNQTQLASTLRDTDTFMQQMATINEQLVKITGQTADQNTTTLTLNQSIVDYLNSPVAQKADRAASDNLRQTLRRLQGK
jgi:hypothetical protein